MHNQTINSDPKMLVSFYRPVMVTVIRREKMNDNKSYLNNYRQLFIAIELCLKNKLQIPSLSLIYNGIDTFSWLAYGDICVKERYKRWIEKWMYKNRKLSADPVDLYAARCSILHTLTPYSKLSDEKKAKVICYSWENADLEKLKAVIEEIRPGEFSFVHIDELYELFKEGVINFTNNLETDKELAKQVDEKLSKHYCHLDISIIDEAYNKCV